jgi:hypothetical protein
MPRALAARDGVVGARPKRASGTPFEGLRRARGLRAAPGATRARAAEPERR